MFNNFWNWYDSLEETNPTFRFLLFLGLFLICVTIPQILGNDKLFVFGLVFSSQKT